MKRKRKAPRVDRVEKRQKMNGDGNGQHPWALLRQYYPNVGTLRHYLISRLRRTSKNRAKRVLQYGVDDHFGSFREVRSEAEKEVIRLLDGVAVGTFSRARQDDVEPDLDKDIGIFTQQVSDSISSIGPTQGALKQNEVGRLQNSFHLHDMMFCR
jgi:hypothetical protein